MKEHDSFLKILGMNEDSVVSDETSKLLKFEEVAPIEETPVGFEEQTDRTEKDVDPMNRTDLQTIENPLAPEALALESIDSEKTEQDLPETFDGPTRNPEGDFSPEQLYTDEIDTGSESTVDDEYPTEERTIVYSNDESKRLGDNLREGMSLEDRLLEGVEEAEASRFTDIFAKSFRDKSKSDGRKTQFLLGALDELDEVSEGRQTIDLENPAQSSITGSIESTETKPEESGRRTLAFAYDDAAENYGRLVLIEGNANAKVFHLGKFPLRFGRDPLNEVIIDDSNVSRFHAEIFLLDGKLAIKDLGSTNGVKVNGAIYKESIIESHDLIQVGLCFFELLAAGEVSQGPGRAAKESALAVTSSVPISVVAKKRNIRKMTTALLLVGAALLSLPKVLPMLRDGSKQVIQESMVGALNEFKEDLEGSFEKPLAEIEPEDVKTLFLKKVESTPLPDNFKAQLGQLPASFVVTLVDDPELTKELIETEGNLGKLRTILRMRLQVAVRERQDKQALTYVDILLSLNPNDKEMLKLRSDLRQKSSYVELQKGEEITEGDKELFNSYMKQHQESAQKMIDENELDRAKAFSEDVRTRILDLVNKKPAFGEFAESAIAEWSAKIEFINKKVEERDGQKKVQTQEVDAGNKAIEQIKDFMDQGRVYEAGLAIDDFLKKYPKHPEYEQAQAYKEEIQKVIEASFQSMMSQIDTFNKTENYKMAWDTLYRFLDLVPGFRPALQVREDLNSQTRMKARQYYNQARVFEFEADDLISAEQYYKRTLETADPRGDLALKAERRYAEVRRKSIQ